MIRSINCVYETPCGWCSKWDKQCNKKNDTDVDLSIQNEDLTFVDEILQKLLGVSMYDCKGGYRPTPVVLRDIALALRNIRSISEKESYEVIKESVILALLGRRFRYEFEW